MSKINAFNKEINEKEKNEQNLKNGNNENKLDKNIIGHLNDDNFIIGEIKIDKDELKRRIINSYDNFYKEEFSFDIDNEEKNESEKSIDYCDIFINDKKIDSNYYYTFPNEGIYKIKYIFKKSLSSANSLFRNCTSLTELDLSHFNTRLINNMGNMFRGCKSLKKINLSNFDTHNVKDMKYMFYGCISLL